MIIIADKKERTDSAYHTLIRNIEGVNIVVVSWVEDFIFNDALLGVKDYVLICFCEYGWNYKITDSHIWGKNKDGSGRYSGGDWDKFDEWVKNNPPLMMFKRELLKKDVSDRVKPIEYPNVVEEDYPTNTKEQFNGRPVSVFQYWGRSNECRLRIHGEIWLHAYKKGFQVCDNIYYVPKYINEEQGEKWITLWIPHYYRIPIQSLLSINEHSKLSLSWPGAGFKCFRTAEAPFNSVMVMYKNDFAWAYDWNETNCILVEEEKEIEGIEAALSNPNLYDIYLKGIENCRKYKTIDYINNYLLPLINQL